MPNIKKKYIFFIKRYFLLLATVCENFNFNYNFSGKISFLTQNFPLGNTIAVIITGIYITDSQSSKILSELS